MPDRDKNRGSLVDASGETLAVIDPIPYVVELVKENPQADDIWKRWLNTNFEYLIGLTRFVDVEDWHEIGATDEPVFENSWVNEGATATSAAFYLDPFGRVYLKGNIKTGTTGTSAFTLPSGYTPSKQMHFTCDAATVQTYSRVQINDNGAVVCYFNGGGAATRHSLDGISFRI